MLVTAIGREFAALAEEDDVILEEEEAAERIDTGYRPLRTPSSKELLAMSTVARRRQTDRALL
ncbi:hypothetical protein ACFV2U_54610 [Streptomyces sp. NPDC059697]|uniref:hypothetical protein n=1 Tax=Streptomyces sp. NPDC059697 TaxID=3346912 RepID=UPI0036B6297C